MLAKAKTVFQAGKPPLVGSMGQVKAEVHHGEGGVALPLEPGHALPPDAREVEETRLFPEPAPSADPSDLEKVMRGEDLSAGWTGDIIEFGDARLGLVYKGPSRSILGDRPSTVYKILKLGEWARRERVAGFCRRLSEELEERTGGHVFFVGGFTLSLLVRSAPLRDVDCVIVRISPDGVGVAELALHGLSAGSSDGAAEQGAGAGARDPVLWMVQSFLLRLSRPVRVCTGVDRATGVSVDAVGVAPRAHGRRDDNAGLSNHGVPDAIASALSSLDRPYPSAAISLLFSDAAHRNATFSAVFVDRHGYLFDLLAAVDAATPRGGRPARLMGGIVLQGARGRDEQLLRLLLLEHDSELRLDKREEKRIGEWFEKLQDDRTTREKEKAKERPPRGVAKRIKRLLQLKGATAAAEALKDFLERLGLTKEEWARTIMSHVNKAASTARPAEEEEDGSEGGGGSEDEDDDDDGNAEMSGQSDD